MRYKMTLSYSGAEFNGWQIQPNAPSVQGCLEDALGKLLRCETKVTGAGRTDTGVNASFYVAHFDAEALPLETGDFCHKLNAILPKAVVVKRIEAVSDDFHARFDAKKREYTYYLHRTKDPFERYSYLCSYPDLDFDRMNEAAAHLLGTHDFSCFEKVGADNKTSICTVVEAGWHKTAEDKWYFRIAADRFLRNMVRAVVGTLIEVGRGKRSVSEFETLVKNPESLGDGKARRCLAGESVPGEALFLSNILY